MPEPALLPAATPSAPAVPEIPPQRRAHRRQLLAALVYVELDEFTGGIMNNLGEGGIEIRCAVPLFDREFAHIRFQLSDQAKWISAPARIVWMRESNRLAGLAFVNPPPEVAAQITSYLGLVSALSAIEIPGERIAASEALDLANAGALAENALPSAEAEDEQGSNSSIDPDSRIEDETPQIASSVAIPDISSDAEIAAALAIAAAAVNSTLPCQSAAAESPQPLQAPLAPASLAQIIPVSAAPPKPQAALAKPVVLSPGWDRAVSILLGLFLLFVGWTARGVRDQSRQETSAASEPIPTQDLNNLQLPGDSPANASANPSPGAASSSASTPAVTAPRRSIDSASSSNLSSAGSSSANPSSAGSLSNASADPSSLSSAAHSQSAGASSSSKADAAGASSSSASIGAENAAATNPASAARTRVTLASGPTALNRMFLSGQLPKRDPISLVANRSLLYRADNSAASANALFSSAITLRALIGPDGRVRTAQPIAGPQSLAAAAIAALRNWRFEILRPQGQPIATTCDVTVAVVPSK